jgi:hypothetical protein
VHPPATSDVHAGPEQYLYSLVAFHYAKRASAEVAGSLNCLQCMTAGMRPARQISVTLDGSENFLQLVHRMM